MIDGKKSILTLLATRTAVALLQDVIRQDRRFPFDFSDFVKDKLDGDKMRGAASKHKELLMENEQLFIQLTKNSIKQYIKHFIAEGFARREGDDFVWLTDDEIKEEYESVLND